MKKPRKKPNYDPLLELADRFTPSVQGQILHDWLVRPDYDHMNKLKAEVQWALDEAGITIEDVREEIQRLEEETALKPKKRRKRPVN